MAEETTAKTASNGIIPGWNLLSRCFRLALSPGQVGLAALGVLSTATAWWGLAVVFGSLFGPTPPNMGGDAVRGTAPANKDAETRKAEWEERKRATRSWNLMHEMAGLGSAESYYDLGDVADTYEEYQILVAAGLAATADPKAKDPSLSLSDQGRELAVLFEKASKESKLAPLGESRIVQIRSRIGQPKPSGVLNTWPWFENRGPNSLLLLMGKEKVGGSGSILDWLLTEQAPVLVEPLVKFLKPVTYLFHPEARFTHRIYLLAVILSTLLVWSFFGGAITRMAAMELARHESVQMTEAVKFSRSRVKDLIVAPLVPLLLVAGMMVMSTVFGLFYMIPVLGDILLGGLAWCFPLLAGLAMTFLLVGLISWPIMVAIVGTDSEDYVQATARGISYLYQRPRSIFMYSVGALLLGAASIFTVGVFSSMSVYLAKWSVSQTPGLDYATGGAKPASLFVTAPTTFGWRALLLDGATVESGAPVVINGKVDESRLKAFSKKTGIGFAASILNSAWLFGAVLLVVGFGYSFFWSSVTALYLWLRHDIDGLETSEVYLEDEDFNAPPATATTSPGNAPAASACSVAESAKPGTVPLSVVDAPAASGKPGEGPAAG